MAKEALSVEPDNDPGVDPSTPSSLLPTIQSL
jgi:hypothetical protein